MVLTMLCILALLLAGSGCSSGGGEINSSGSRDITTVSKAFQGHWLLTWSPTRTSDWYVGSDTLMILFSVTGEPFSHPYRILAQDEGKNSLRITSQYEAMGTRYDEYYNVEFENRDRDTAELAITNSVNIELGKNNP
ncbi:MAG: hypothetical protein NTV33_09675 [Coprothermobacterota bacterium]|nr:hypothetical protein [Coprothermobacterota bacterium]